MISKSITPIDSKTVSVSKNSNEYTVTLDDITFTQVVQLDPPFILMLDTVNHQLVPIPIDSSFDSTFTFFQMVTNG
jgi:hypothetical protein